MEAAAAKTCDDPQVVYISREPKDNKKLQKMLERLKDFDPETYEHSRRVEECCREIAEFLDLSRGAIKLLALAGVFHDIGKITLPIELVRKNGNLTEEEKGTMDKHGHAGFALLNSYNLELARLVLLHHYEELITDGMPAILPYRVCDSDLSRKRELWPCTITDPDTDILLFPLLVVADRFDALVSPRHYKESWNAERIWQNLARKFPNHRHIIKMLLQTHCSPLSFEFE